MCDPTSLLLWTVRLAVLIYAILLGLFLGGWIEPFRGRWIRFAWTAGCLLLVAHILLSFHLVHGWSHDDAVRQTANRTAELTGVRSGAGVYLNYLFVAVWTADVVYWWRAGHARYWNRRRAVVLAVHGFMLFIVFNAAVVFATGATRYVGTALAVAVVVVAVLRRRPIGPTELRRG